MMGTELVVGIHPSMSIHRDEVDRYEVLSNHATVLCFPTFYA